MAANKIIMQDLSTMAEPVVIVSGDFLNFSQNNLITGINVIEDLLFWTDNRNQPRKININKAINDTSYYDSEDKISVAKYSPYAAPILVEHQNPSTVTNVRTLTNESGISSEYMKENFLRFSYRYKFHDNEYSLIAPFTQVVFAPQNNGCIIADSAELDPATTDSPTDAKVALAKYGAKNAFRTGRLPVMQNSINNVQLRVPLPMPNDINLGYTRRFDGAVSASSSFNIDGGTLDAGTYIIKGADDSATTDGICQVIFTSNQSGTITVTTASGTASGSNNDQLAFVPMWENAFNLKSIEILAKESDDAAVRVVGEIDVKDLRSFYDNVDIYPHKVWSNQPSFWRHCVVFNYKSEKPYKVLPEGDIVRVSDKIPIQAKSQEVVSNRIVYGNYLSNYQYPTDAAGNKGISYTVSSSAKGAQEITSSVPNDWLNLQHAEFAHRYASVKQRRTYQVGIVLSDRYGRQSPVILSSVKQGKNRALYNVSDTVTVANDSGYNSALGFSAGPGGSGNFSWSSEEDNIIGKLLTIEFKDSFIVPLEQAYSSNNVLGWYSYRLVVKQTQQDYYNIYASHPATEGANSSSPSYISLFGDNINKVPRSILEVDINKNNLSGSDELLFPKVIQSGATDTESIMQTHDDSTLIDVVNLGTVSQFDTASSPSLPDVVFNQNKNPLLAEIVNLNVFYDTTNPTATPADYEGLTVFETEPFESKLDVYYETSTCGLVTDLNYSLNYAPPASAPTEESIQFTGGSLSTSINENIADTTAIGTVEATKGNASNSLQFEILHLWSYLNNNQVDIKNRVSLSTAGALTATGVGFAHRNSAYDEYDLVTLVSEYTSGGVYTGSAIRTLRLSVNNVAPNISAESASNVEVLYDERFDVPVVVPGETYTGSADNGGLNAVEKNNDLVFGIDFATLSAPGAGSGTDEAIKAWANQAFKVVQQGNKWLLKTTWVYELNDKWDQYGLPGLEQTGSLSKSSFFDAANKIATVTVTDSGGLTNTTNITIAEKEDLKVISHMRFTAHVKEPDKNVNQIGKRFTAYIGRGSASKPVDASNPMVKNIMYHDKNKTLLADKIAEGSGSNSYYAADRHIMIIYKYTKLGYPIAGQDGSGGKNVEAKYDYVVIHRDTSVIIYKSEFYTPNTLSLLKSAANPTKYKADRMAWEAGQSDTTAAGLAPYSGGGTYEDTLWTDDNTDANYKRWERFKK
jgi:hypothetical protein